MSDTLLTRLTTVAHEPPHAHPSLHAHGYTLARKRDYARTPDTNVCVMNDAGHADLLTTPFDVWFDPTSRHDLRALGYAGRIFGLEVFLVLAAPTRAALYQHPLCPFPVFLI